MNKRTAKQRATSKSGGKTVASRPLVATLILSLGLIALLFSMAASISFGAAEIDIHSVWTSITQFDATLTAHQIIQEIRMPRAIAAALVGAFLAISGAILQGMTRNPLAAPSTMGITDGAAFALAIALAFYPGITSMGLIAWSFIGAAIGASLVFMVGSFSKGGLTPVKLALAGAAVGALLRSISATIAIRFDVAQDMSFWYAGSVAGAQWQNVRLLIPIAAIGLILAFILSRSITVLNLGEDVAKGLGQQTVYVKVLAAVLIVLLTGAAVSIAGTVGFIGLIIPHLTRFLVGVDYRLIVPCAGILGALLLVLADLGARMINPPFETPVGIITALIGVPFFLYLARREGKGL
ncbi:FecCD family ABC transporter permease [Halalkalibacterium ligniniphilum]|uniref:FecCD family ABC transporter permease n=1 Tax=Halalkalibacterium ligniniphilum TaxID=1134413 RepID=UPI0003458699|nr:iron ABC transporter permease [Halalkalibacterium ligniniphilum]